MDTSIVQTFGFLTFLTMILLVLGEAYALVALAVPVFAVAWFIVLRGARDPHRPRRR